ncbi:UNVERIFIED_CONTAM: hypothetical protein K2H54_004112 [Gekko kuhli]
MSDEEGEGVPTTMAEEVPTMTDETLPHYYCDEWGGRIQEAVERPTLVGLLLNRHPGVMDYHTPAGGFQPLRLPHLLAPDFPQMDGSTTHIRTTG